MTGLARPSSRELLLAATKAAATTSRPTKRLRSSEVSLKLEIDAEVPCGIDRAKARTLLENASTLGFIDKLVR
jgi:hypothetical protein